MLYRLSTAQKIGWKMVTPFLILLNNLPFPNPLSPHLLTDLPLTNSQPMFVGMAYFAYFCKTKARNGGGSVPLGMLAMPVGAASASPKLALCPLKNHY